MGEEGSCSLTTSETLTSESVGDATKPFLSFIISREHPDQTRTGFGSESLLLRGCTIRNTEVAVGIVIYTGYCPWTLHPCPFSSFLQSLLQIHLLAGGSSHLRGRGMWFPVSQLQTEAGITAAHLVHRRHNSPESLSLIWITQGRGPMHP